MSSVPSCHPLNESLLLHFTSLRSISQSRGKTVVARQFAAVQRALKRYPLPIESVEQALGLEGVGAQMGEHFARALAEGRNTGGRYRFHVYFKRGRFQIKLFYSKVCFS